MRTTSAAAYDRTATLAAKIRCCENSLLRGIQRQRCLTLRNCLRRERVVAYTLTDETDGNDLRPSKSE